MRVAAEQLYVQATTVDPKFALAYARASLLNSRYRKLLTMTESGRRKRAPRRRRPCGYRQPSAKLTWL